MLPALRGCSMPKLAKKDRETALQGMFFRNLIRVQRISVFDNAIYVIIPAWSAHLEVRVPLYDLPSHVIRRLWVQQRFHAQVNSGVERKDALVIKDWEEGA